MSAPGVKFTADQDVSEVGSNAFAEASRRMSANAAPAAGTAPGATPERGLTTERLIAIGAGAIALVAVGVAGGVLFTNRGADPAPTGVAVPLPTTLPVTPAIAGGAEAITVPGTVTPTAVLPTTPDAGGDAGEERRHGKRRGGRERDRDRTVVGGVPIYDDDDF